MTAAGILGGLYSLALWIGYRAGALSGFSLAVHIGAGCLALLVFYMVYAIRAGLVIEF